MARPALTPDRIVDAAMTVADRGGLPAVSMRNVAKELGVEAMSLYHHVASKDSLLDTMVNRIFERIELPAPDQAWREGMRSRAASARAMLSRHPWAFGLIESRRTPPPALLRHHDTVIGCLRRDGFSVELAAHAFSVIDAYVYGFAQTEVNLPFEPGDDLANMADEMLDSMAGEYPYLAELITKHAMRPGYSYDKEFEYGLELILDGLSRRH